MSSDYAVTKQCALIDSPYVVHRKGAVESIAHCVDVVRAEWLAAALTERDLLRRQVEVLVHGWSKTAECWKCKKLRSISGLCPIKRDPVDACKREIIEWSLEQAKKGGGVSELGDISDRLKTQDNRCTVDPMFCLQIKVRDVGYDPQYSDGNTVWINMESGEYEEVAPETEGAKEFGFKDRWETIMVAFTEKGIEDYMIQNGHNVRRMAYKGETRIFVESFRRCDEMIRIRKFIMEDEGRRG